jgi:hypothetical protein
MVFGLVSKGWDKGYSPHMLDKLILQKLPNELILVTGAAALIALIPNLTTPA